MQPNDVQMYMQILARKLISNDFSQNMQANCPVARVYNHNDIKKSHSTLEPAFMDLPSL